MLSEERKREIIARLNRNLETGNGVLRLLNAIFPLNKPDRDTIINRDDITNLKILLNASQTLEEFLERV